MEIKTYVVNMASDHHRRGELNSKFVANSKNFEFVEAVDGRTLSSKAYFSQISQYHSKYGELLTPSEVGCALSHKSIYQKMVEERCSSALVLEDDILGDDNCIDRISNLVNGLSGAYILICGGQQGLESYGKLLGSRTAIPKVFRIPKLMRRYLYRTCCYVVSDLAAKKLLEVQSETLHKADDWFKMDLTGVDVFFTDILSHPIDLAQSSIQAERQYILKSRYTSLLKGKLIALIIYFLGSLEIILPWKRISNV